MQVNWIFVGAVGVAMSIGLGAFGAHGLRARLDVDALALWETAARYLMYASLGLVAVGLFDRQTDGAAGVAGWMLVAGAVVFSTTLVGLALGGPRWLGAVTPLGGALMIFAWLRVAWGALRALN